MRRLAMTALVLGVACAGGHARPDRWWSRYPAFRSLRNADQTVPQPYDDGEPVIAAVTKEPDGLETWDLYTKFDPETNDTVESHPVLVRIEHATGTVEHDFNSDHDTATSIYAIETADLAKPGAKRWFVLSIQNGKLAAMSPPLKGVVGIYGYSSEFLAVVAGEEPDLVIPLDDNGRLATLPPGVIGAKPVVVKNDASKPSWRAWFVRWGGAQPGWSITRRILFDQLPADGPRWTDLKPTVFDTPHGQVDGFYGTRVGGGCEALGFYYKDLVLQPPDAIGATCDEARDHMIAMWDAALTDAREKAAKLAAEEAERRRLDQEVRDKENAEAARRYHHDLEVEARYAQAIAGGTFTSATCAIALELGVARHRQLVVPRAFGNVALPGEVACLTSRPDNGFAAAMEDAKRRHEDALRDQRILDDARARAEESRQRAAAREAEEERHRNFVYVNPWATTPDPNAAQKRVDAMQKWGNGYREGACPYTEPGLCR